MKYILSGLIYDILGMIPIIVNTIYFKQLSPNISALLQVLFLFKSNTIFEILRKLDYTFGMKEKWENTVEFGKMLMFVVISAHFMAIGYHSVATYDRIFLK